MRFQVAAIPLIAALSAPGPLRAQAEAPQSRPAAAAEEIPGVGIDEHLDFKLPLDLKFTDEGGATVELGKYFDGKRPVILTLVYFGCPMLCGLVSNAQMQAMKDIPDWLPGREYQAVTVSFDPRETPELARLKKQNYLNAMGNPEAGKGWHFLTGRQDEISKLAGAVGFRYVWDDRQGQFIHQAAIYIITPDGRISRYLYGVGYDARLLRLSLVEASQGKIGSTVDHVLLYCFQYDPTKRVYTLAARNLMAAAAGLTVLAMAAWLVPVWVRSSRRPLPAAGPGEPPG